MTTDIAVSNRPKTMSGNTVALKTVAAERSGTVLVADDELYEAYSPAPRFMILGYHEDTIRAKLHVDITTMLASLGHLETDAEELHNSIRACVIRACQTRRNYVNFATGLNESHVTAPLVVSGEAVRPGDCRIRVTCAGALIFRVSFVNPMQWRQRISRAQTPTVKPA